MPIYEFQCQKCKGVQEEILPVGSGADGLECRKCGGSELKKVLSVIARSPSVATGGEPCEVGAGCPAGGCCHGCGDMD